MADPTHLARILTSSIRACGGWILSRGTTDGGFVNLLFEFERRACVDIYAALIAAGLELSQLGHLRLTELCQCTRNQAFDCGSEVASIELEIQTFLDESAPRDLPNAL